VTEKGTRRSCVRGSKNLTRGRPDGSPNVTEPLRRGWDGERIGRAETRLTALWRGLNLKREDRGAHVSRRRYDEENPEVVKTTWGERRKPIKRYSPDTIKTLKRTRTSRESGRARVTVRGSKPRISQVSGEAEKTAMCLHLRG